MPVLLDIHLTGHDVPHCIVLECTSLVNAKDASSFQEVVIYKKLGQIPLICETEPSGM